MPVRDPGNWPFLIQVVIDFFSHYLPNMLAALLTFAVALTQGLKHGGPWKKAFLNATSITLLGVGLFPFFVATAARFEWPVEVAFAACVFLAVMGTEWIKNKADELFEVIVGRWRKP